MTIFVKKLITYYLNLIANLYLKMKILFIELYISIKGFITLIIINLLKIPNENRRKWFLKKFGKIIALLTILYQIILVTISYSEFETFNDMKAELIEQQRLAMTFCLRNMHKFYDNYDYDPLKYCVMFLPNGYVGSFNCTHIIDFVQSLTRFSHRCFSLFSQLFVKTNLSLAFYSIALHDNYIYDFGLMHRTRTPPHFSGDKI